MVTVANSVSKSHDGAHEGTPVKDIGRHDSLSPPASPEKLAPSPSGVPTGKTKGPDAAASQDRIPVYLVLLLVTGYICFGATLFSFWERWSFLDGAYFSFITLSTIGFGDIVPGSTLFEQNTASTSGQAKLIICCFYLVLGLAIIAMSFNLVQEEVLLKCKDLVRGLKNLISTDDAASVSTAS